jgi:hypothetical protein
MPTPPNKLVRNEKRKLTAGFLNTLASGSIFAAFVGPAIGAGEGASHLPPLGRWAFGASIWCATGILCHLIARALINGLEE